MNLEIDEIIMFKNFPLHMVYLMRKLQWRHFAFYVW
jgi:hypothetical protein